MLEHQLRNAEKSQHRKAFAQAAKKGAVVPTFDDGPVIQVPHRWLWTAYCLLAEKRCRTEQFPQPIQVGEIKALADIQGIDDFDQLTTLFWVITALDRVAMAHFWTGFKTRQEQSAADSAARRQRK